MIVIPVAAKRGDEAAAKQPEIEQPHLVLTFLSLLCLIAGLGLLAAAL